MGFPSPSWHGIKEFFHDSRQWLGEKLLGRGREEEIERLLEKLEEEAKKDLNEERDPSRTATLKERLEDTRAARRAFTSARLERLLKKAGYRPYEALIADGQRMLEPEPKAELRTLWEYLERLEKELGNEE